MRNLLVSMSTMVCARCAKLPGGIRLLSQTSQSSTFIVPAQNIGKVPIQFQCNEMQTEQIDIAEWYSSRVISNQFSCEGIRSMEVEVPSSIYNQYRHPGQYIKVRRKDGGTPNFLSMCSPPKGKSALSFLVKEAPCHNEILNLNEGDTIELSHPLGKGFQLDVLNQCNSRSSPCSPTSLFTFPPRSTSALDIRELVLVACGSGLAPIAAAIESGQLGLLGDAPQNDIDCNIPPHRHAKLYVGARSPAHLPLSHKYDSWKELGIEVIPVFSRYDLTTQCLGSEFTSTTPSDGTIKARDGNIRNDEAMVHHRRKYVQEVIRKNILVVPKNTVALLCGMREMTHQTRAILMEAGVPEKHILQNF